MAGKDAPPAQPSGKPPILPIVTAVLATLLAALLAFVIYLMATNKDTPAPTRTETATHTPAVTPAESTTPAATATTEPPTEPETPTTTTPATEPEPEPEPAAPKAKFTWFRVTTPVYCETDMDVQGVFFNYTAKNAVYAWLGVDTNNAKAHPYQSIDPKSGDVDVNFACSEESHKYTLTLENADGVLTHKTVTVTRDLAP